MGREKELDNLDKAWDAPKTHVVTIVAWGGVGKTALVVDWMARMAGEGWRGAARVFDWSFYSQGTSETSAASSDVFVAKALEFLGDSEMAQSAASPWDKGERLARLVAERKTLLVLDGVEPLQYPPGPVGGKLKDPALEAMLKGLAQQNAGLCIVTTREPVTDLAPFRETTAPEWSLEHLSEEAGAQLLFDSGVRRAGNAQIKADDQELRDAARQVGGHALTLRLLGNHLRLAYNGDIRKRDVIAFKEADAQFKTSSDDAEKSYGHAFKVMRAYEIWLSKAGEEGKRQLAVLHLLGLFDRPADAGCLAALRQEPVIDGLTGPLVNLTEAQWNTTISRLAECGIVAVHRDESATGNRQSAIDAHPLVREYFGRRLREKNPSVWQQAHRRLYEHLTESTEHRPDSLAGLQPLYQAVAHGCQAGMHQDACDKVYDDRILRGTSGPDAFYSTKRLGAFGSDLAAVTCFFERPWTAVSHQLSEADQGWLLNGAATCLRALGRLNEALGPERASGEMDVQCERWSGASISYGNLSELELTLGQVDDATTDGEKILTFADRSEEWGVHQMYRASYADALHQAGQQNKAAEHFRQVEVIQAKDQPQYPLLYSVRGFRYCDLLLGPAERAAWKWVVGVKTMDPGLKTARVVCRAVKQRAGQTLEWEKEARLPLISIAMDRLSLGRAALYEAILLKDARRKTPDARHKTPDSKRKTQDSRLAEAGFNLTEAVDGVRRAAQLDLLPRGLLSRALFRFVEGDTDACRADLAEAWQIAERGSMRLHQADVLLHKGRLFRDKAALAEARKLIEECGYHRRDGELADAEEAARTW